MNHSLTSPASTPMQNLASDLNPAGSGSTAVKVVILFSQPSASRDYLTGALRGIVVDLAQTDKLIP